MLVFMVRGLFSRLEYPYVQFPCHTLSSDEMFDPFWEAVSRLERLGLKVMGLCCDGLAANRRYFSLHSDKAKAYKVVNPYAEENRSLYFFSDPPHLIKTVRNAWANPKRHLWVCHLCVHTYVYHIVNDMCIIVHVHVYQNEYNCNLLCIVIVLCAGQGSQWTQLRCLYERNRPISESPSLAMLPTIKFEHVNLSSFSKMRVDLAAQVSPM